MKRNMLYAAVLLGITACASSPDKIQSSHISPLQYQNYNCTQIVTEMDSVNTRANELYGTLKKTADNDSAQMAVGMILFWPSLFFLEGGDGPEAAEYARLKGEREALEKVAIEKKCDISKLTNITDPTKEKESEEQKKQGTS